MDFTDFIAVKPGNGSGKDVWLSDSEESFETHCGLPEEAGSPCKQQHPGELLRNRSDQMDLMKMK